LPQTHSSAGAVAKRTVNSLSIRLDALLTAETKARETVEEAERKARSIRTGIPGEISAAEAEYSNELEKYEKIGMEKVQKELEEMKLELDIKLEKQKKEVDSRASILAPRALELLRKAIEGGGA